MAVEERAHADLWERVARAGRRNRLPPIFDEPQTVRESLGRILERARTVALQWESGGAVSHPFVLACRLELFMLHPAFATLFYFARTLFGVDFYTTYDKHLECFIQALQTYCQMMPELELLGETLPRLWKQNRLSYVWCGQGVRLRWSFRRPTDASEADVRTGLTAGEGGLRVDKA